MSAATGHELQSLLSLPGLNRVRDLVERLPQYPQVERLSPELAAAFYQQREGETRVFRSSVSRLETFAACPFRFFVEAGLRAEERKHFEVDPRERGTLQHAVLEQFHLEIIRSGRRWRDVPPDEAVALIGRLVEESARTYRDGLFLDDDRNQFTVTALKDALQRFIRVVIGWMRSYQLDPTFVEVGFGMMEHSLLPAWRIPLGDGCELALRGKVDRVDLGPSDNGTPWCVVLDYKSGERKLDALQMHNGLQLQLAAYLAALASFARAGLIPGCAGVQPAGMFYANLRGAQVPGDSRDAVLQRDESERAMVYQHSGRFSVNALTVLDANAATAPSGQFNFKVNKDGSLNKRQADPMDPAAFAGLLGNVRTKLEEFARRILSGEAAVDPYRLKSVRACDRCELGAVCRIEPRTHRFRALVAPPKAMD